VICLINVEYATSIQTNSPVALRCRPMSEEGMYTATVGQHPLCRLSFHLSINKEYWTPDQQWSSVSFTHYICPTEYSTIWIFWSN